jgi:hypothetical protein
LIAYTGEDSVKHWNTLREDGKTILNHMRYHGAINRMGLFKSVPNYERLGLIGASPRSCYLEDAPLFKGLVGFELEPRYRSFKADRMTIFMDGSRFTRELCFSSGLIYQPVIAVDPEIASDSGKLWIVHKFELLDRCARGCEMIAEIVEREMAADNQADSDDTDDGDGLFGNDRILVWGGVRFTLSTNQAIVFRLLVDAYPGDVTHGAFEDKQIRVLRDSFRFNAKERKKRGYDYYLCWGLIADGSAKDSKRLIDPRIVRSDPEKFSGPRHNPQRPPM